MTWELLLTGHWEGVGMRLQGQKVFIYYKGAPRIIDYSKATAFKNWVCKCYLHYNGADDLFAHPFFSTQVNGLFKMSSCVCLEDRWGQARQGGCALSVQLPRPMYVIVQQQIPHFVSQAETWRSDMRIYGFLRSKCIGQVNEWYTCMAQGHGFVHYIWFAKENM